MPLMHRNNPEASPPNPSGGAPQPDQATARPTSVFRRYRIRMATVTVVGGLVALLCLVTFGYFNKGHPNKDLAVCASNLKRLEAALRVYIGANNNVYPPLSPRNGELTFTPGSVPLTYSTQEISLTCPTLRSAGKRPSPAHNDQSYCYLGYAVLDDDDVEAFASAYRKQLAAGKAFDAALRVDEGPTTRVLHRLSEKVDAVWRATGDPNAVSPYEGHETTTDWGAVVTADIPVLIERDRGHVFTDWDGRPRVIHALYLHSGLHMVQQGTWPFTKKTQRILAELADQ